MMKMKKKGWKQYTAYLQDQVDELMDTVEALRGDLLKAQYDNPVADAWRAENKKQAAYIDELRGQIDGLMATIDPQSARIADLEEQLGESQAGREASGERAKWLEWRADEDRKELRELRGKLGAVEAERELKENNSLSYATIWREQALHFSRQVDAQRGQLDAVWEATKCLDPAASISARQWRAMLDQVKAAIE